MALTPEQAMELTEWDMRALADCETVVDGELRQEFTGSNRVSIGVAGVPHRLVPHLIARYREAGWSIDPIDNPREGTYLEFSRARHV